MEKRTEKYKKRAKKESHSLDELFRESRQSLEIIFKNEDGLSLGYKIEDLNPDALKSLRKSIESAFKDLNLLPTALKDNRELTTTEAGEVLNVSRQYVANLADSGTLPHSKVGKHRRFKYSDVMEYKKSRIAAKKLAKLTEEMYPDEFK